MFMPERGLTVALYPRYAVHCCAGYEVFTNPGATKTSSQILPGHAQPGPLQRPTPHERLAVMTGSHRQLVTAHLGNSDVIVDRTMKSVCIKLEKGESRDTETNLICSLQPTFRFQSFYFSYLYFSTISFKTLFTVGPLLLDTFLF